MALRTRASTNHNAALTDREAAAKQTCCHHVSPPSCVYCAKYIFAFGVSGKRVLSVPHCLRFTFTAL